MLRKYSFALYPEKLQPSGTCNFSQINNAQLGITANFDQVTEIRVFAHGYNILKISSGMGGLAYSN